MNSLRMPRCSPPMVMRDPEIPELDRVITAAGTSFQITEMKTESQVTGKFGPTSEQQ